MHTHGVTATQRHRHPASPPPSVTATQRHRYPASSSPASTQERQLRLELERIKAEEAASAAEESCERSLKARYAEEERFSRVNRLKIDTQWRKLMRLVKVEELRKQVEIISQRHEQQVDLKDATIQRLDLELDESEEQQTRLARLHLSSVDALIAIHERKSRREFEHFARERESLVDEFGAERQSMSDYHDAFKLRLLQVSQIMEAEFKEGERDAKHEFESAREEIKNRSGEEYNVLRYQAKEPLTHVSLTQVSLTPILTTCMLYTYPHRFPTCSHELPISLPNLTREHA